MNKQKKYYYNRQEGNEHLLWFGKLQKAYELRILHYICGLAANFPDRMSPKSRYHDMT